MILFKKIILGVIWIFRAALISTAVYPIAVLQQSTYLKPFLAKLTKQKKLYF